MRGSYSQPLARPNGHDCIRGIHERMTGWDDLRFLLAVCRSGTLASAARTLGCSQPTVSRRMSRLARRHGAALFETLGGRYVPTSAGRARRAWLAFLTGYSPNAYLVDVDAETGIALLHDLVPRRSSEEPA